MQAGGQKKRIYTIAALAIALCALLFFYLKVKKKHRPASASVTSSPALATDFKRRHFQTGTLLFSESTDLENVKDKSVSPEKSVSGMHSIRLSATSPYGYPIVKKIAEIPSYKSLTTIQLRFKCWMRNDIPGAQYLLVITGKDGKSLAEFSRPVACPKKYEWNDLRYTYFIDPKFLEPENSIRLYATNKQVAELYIDDINVSFIAESPEAQQPGPEFTSNFLYDFEKPDSILLRQSTYIREGKAHSGKMAFDLSGAEEYGPIITRQAGTVSLQPVKRINMSIWVYPSGENASIDLVVALFNDANEKFFIQSKKTGAKLLPKEQWTKVNATIGLPAGGAAPDDVIQVLARNRGRTQLLFDDFEIVYDAMQDAPGEASALTPEATGGQGFVPQRNTPPFPVLYLQKQQIGNSDSPFLVNSGGSVAGDLTPGDEFLSGNFNGNAEGLDQLIAVKESEVALYSYCSNKKQFIQAWKSNNSSDLELFGASAEKLSGDFDGRGPDEVLCISRKNKTARLASFTGGNNCLPATGMPLWTVEEKKEQPFGNWSISMDDMYITGDFNGDGRTELLAVNAKSGNWILLRHSDAKAWEVVAESSPANRFGPSYFSSKTGKQVCGRFLPGKSSDVLYVSATDGSATAYAMLTFDPVRKQFDQTLIAAGSSHALFFRKGNTTLAGNFGGAPAQELLNLDTRWRFGLELIRADASGLTIAGTIDFKGYPADHNPKYYEFVKVVAGHFTGREKTALLVIMRNCADRNFSGDACRQYEDLDYLPNSTQLYQFEP